MKKGERGRGGRRGLGPGGEVVCTLLHSIDHLCTVFRSSLATGIREKVSTCLNFPKKIDVENLKVRCQRNIQRFKI